MTYFNLAPGAPLYHEDEYREEPQPQLPQVLKFDQVTPRTMGGSHLLVNYEIQVRKNSQLKHFNYLLSILLVKDVIE